MLLCPYPSSAARGVWVADDLSGTAVSPDANGLDLEGDPKQPGLETIRCRNCLPALSRVGASFSTGWRWYLEGIVSCTQHGPAAGAGVQSHLAHAKPYVARPSFPRARHSGLEAASSSKLCRAMSVIDSMRETVPSISIGRTIATV